MINLIIIIFGIILFVSFYVLIRNIRVYEFQRYIVDACFYNLRAHLNSQKLSYEVLKEHDELHNKVIKLLNKHSYSSMIWSFKPLNLESWYTKDEIKLIQGTNIV